MAATKVSDTRGGPTAVLMTTDDGEREEVFATRWQADLFLLYIPVMALVSDEFAAVRFQANCVSMLRLAQISLSAAAYFLTAKMLSPAQR